MKKILILFGHPAFTRSKINAALRKSVETLDGITFHDLYEHYPDFNIDVGHEQMLCETHDILVFQHPLYWYSTPAILKEWLDLVLEHGWGYGSEGRALEGKYFFQALTAGGDDSDYSEVGLNFFTIRELTSTFRATANLCRMIWLPPYAVLGVHRGLPYDQIMAHANDYKRAMIALRDEKIDFAKLQTEKYFNSNLDSVMGNK